MKLCFVLLAAALLAWCAVDARPGTTKKEDLDGIGDDLDDFFKHKDRQQNTHRQQTDGGNIFSNTNLNTKKPSSSGSDLLGDLLNGFRGQGGSGSSGLGSLGSLGGLGGFGGLNTRPSNPPSSVQYPSRPASAPSSPSAHYPAVPSAPASAPASRPASSAQYPSRPASNVPSYPSYPSYPSVPSSGSHSNPPAGGWVVPGGNTAPKASGSYPSYPSSYPSYPSYTNYQRGNPSPYPAYPGYQQPAYQQPAYQQPAYQQPAYQQPAYPAYQPTYSGPQTVQRYDPRNPPPAPTKSTGSSISKFFKKIFS